MKVETVICTSLALPSSILLWYGIANNDWLAIAWGIILIVMATGGIIVALTDCMRNTHDD